MHGYSSFVEDAGWNGAWKMCIRPLIELGVVLSMSKLNGSTGVTMSAKQMSLGIRATK